MSALLSVEGLEAGYDDAIVLRDLDLVVDEREIVAVVGANGAGKSTLLRAILGLIRRRAGRIVFAGEDITRLPAHSVVERRLVMVPEGGRMFGFMTVQENLELGAFSRLARPDLKRSLEEVFGLFPILAERRGQLAGSLSGGERSMCAIGRAVMARPRLLMLDEPSLGLSPLMVDRVFALVASLASRMDIGIVLVEQNVTDALRLASRGYVIDRGRITKTGTGEALLADPSIRQAYMGL